MTHYNLQRYDVVTHVVDGIAGMVDDRVAFFLTDGQNEGTSVVSSEIAASFMLVVGRPGALDVDGNYLWKLTIA